MSALDRESVWIFQPKMVGIQAQIRTTNGHVTALANKLRPIHRQIVMDLARKAAKRLDDKTVRPVDMRTGRLKEAILNPESHIATDTGFVFLDYEAMYSQVVYWRLIEEGTRMFVGQRRRFIFLSGKTGRPVLPRASRRGTDFVEIDKDRTVRGRTITTPIYKHEYAKWTVKQFKRDRYAKYRTLIGEAAQGLPLKIS